MTDFINRAGFTHLHPVVLKAFSLRGPVEFPATTVFIDAVRPLSVDLPNMLSFSLNILIQ